MSKRELAALEQKGIKEGDTVRTAYRGGVREGKVEEITEEPKVVFTRKRPGQKDKTVAHNPSTLEKVEPGSSDEESEELGKAKSAVQRSGRGRKAKGGKKKGAAGKKGGSGAGKESESSEEEENGGQDAGGPKKAPTKKVAGGGGGKSAGGSAHAARHSSRIATRRHRREAGTSEAVAGEEKVGYRKRSKREE